MSSSSNIAKRNLENAKSFLKESGLEEQFLKSAGISSLDELDPVNFTDPMPIVTSPVMKPTASGAPVLPRAPPRESADAHTGFTPSTASDMLMPYLGLNIRYVPRKALSTYTPCSLMMDYILHQINDLLCDNFYFKRGCPDYHPYILRLYYGVLFWVQCLRAARDVRALEEEGHQFLVRFLEAYPPESLTISSPLLDLFKTLCSSQPEIPTYGKVYPALPSSPGPARRDSFINEAVNSFFLPNVPGIIALLEHLNLVTNPAVPADARFPKKGKHIPVPANANAATVFGHHSFPASDQRSDLEKWSLCSSGLQYPCEADSRLHEGFAERYESFCLPVTHAADDIRFLATFLSLDGDISWFSQVRDVAAAEASFFNGSGTLADCAPSGIMSNQICVEYIAPSTLPTAPTRSADPLALFPFVIKMHTTARKLPELCEVMAATAQTHVRMFSTHPYLGGFGTHTDCGAFWSVRPLESSPKDESSYLTLKGIIRGLMKPKG